ncbi:MAG TPA: hypothetical protein VE987_11890 [Polyangiaceae bacterium]|nr:hypothetical protein [Polyangiaceae bacterium]
MKKILVVLAGALVACTSGQGEVDVTATQVATFAPPAVDLQGLAAAGQTPTVTADGYVTLDLKDDLASLGGVGSLSATLSKNTLSGADLGYVRHVTATLASVDGTMPAVLASDVDVPEGSTQAELALSMTDSQLLEYLAEGKVSVHFFVTGTLPDRPITLTHTLVAHVNVQVSGSVLKL